MVISFTPCQWIQHLLQLKYRNEEVIQSSLQCFQLLVFCGSILQNMLDSCSATILNHGNCCVIKLQDETLALAILYNSFNAVPCMSIRPSVISFNDVNYGTQEDDSYHFSIKAIWSIPSYIASKSSQQTEKNSQGHFLLSDDQYTIKT
jgi:hypothetical protein